MSLKPLPIGVDIFEKIFQQGYYYVDKSLFIKELLDKKGDINLFTRPRRFGKTLTLGMLKCFFEDTGDDERTKRNKSMFSRLKIMEETMLCEEHMGKYPVVFLTLKSAKQPNFHLAYCALTECISKEYRRYSSVLNQLKNEADREKYTRIMNMKGDREDFNVSLQFLCECLVEVYHKNTIILIDEYDVPLENAYFAGFYDEMIGFIRSLFESALKTNQYLEFAVITGCLRISKESIFTGFNNLEINSILSDAFSKNFGFTEEEVKEMLRYYSREDKFDVIKRWYDGYVFGRTEVYNPWSVINHVKSEYLTENPYPKPYWANTSSNSIVRTLIEKADISVRDEIEVLIAGGTIEKPIHEEITYEDIEKTEDNLWNFLFFTGYLKVINTHLNIDQIYATMMIPNMEVTYIYKNTIRDWFTEKVKLKDLSDMFSALFSANAEVLQKEINIQLMDSISFMDSKEDFYHGFMLGVFRNLHTHIVKSNREGGSGRLDILVRSHDITQAPVVIELKVSDKVKELDADCEKALKQIEEKQYDADLPEEGYTEVLHLGIAFFRKQCRVKFIQKKLEY